MAASRRPALDGTRHSPGIHRQIDVYREVPDPYNEAEIELTAVFAEQASLALELPPPDRDDPAPAVRALACA